MLEAVINVSEGRHQPRLTAISIATGAALLDVHSDADHHRSVFTIAAPDEGETVAAARRLADAAFEHLDLRIHRGVHPRLGIVDVVPFVALAPTPPDIAVSAAHAFGSWLAETHNVPVFFYADASTDQHTLPNIRREAFRAITPDTGPPAPDPRLGATAVGARPPLIAVNVELDTSELGIATGIARDIRERDGGLAGVRALGFALDTRGTVQVSMNLIDLNRTGLQSACTAVRDRADRAGVGVVGVEIVGLIPASEWDRSSPRFRTWAMLDERSTIEARVLRRTRPPQPGGRAHVGGEADDVPAR